MSDTIELLEAIGQNATLRHASAEELTLTLELADASEALKTAVVTGDSFSLAEELGQKPMFVPQHPQSPGHEEEEEEEKPADDEDSDGPEHSPGPSQNKSALDR